MRTLNMNKQEHTIHRSDTWHIGSAWYVRTYVRSWKLTINTEDIAIMNKRLELALCLLSMVTADRSVFGPPNITLNCTTDYMMLTKVVSLSWKPTLLVTNTPLSNDELMRRINNCGGDVRCSNGYKDFTGCPYNSSIIESYTTWEFSIPFNEIACSARVYIDSGGFIKSSKDCSFFASPISAVSMYSPLTNATAGSPYTIMCHVHTSQKVNDAIMKIDWTGPDRSIANSSRIAVFLNASNSTTFISALHFLHVSEDDAGLYICNASIIGTNTSMVRSFKLHVIKRKDPTTIILPSTVEQLSPMMSTVSTTSSISISVMMGTIVTTSKISISVIPSLLHSIVQSPSVSTKNTFTSLTTGPYLIVIIISTIIGVLLSLFLITVMAFYMSRRKLHLKIQASTDDKAHNEVSL